MPWQAYIAPVVLMVAIFIVAIILGRGDNGDS